MQIVAHAYIRMKEVKIKSSFHLIFAGVQDVTAEEKNKLGIGNIISNLNEMIKRTAKNEGVSNIFSGLSSIFPLLSDQFLDIKFPEFLPMLWQTSMSPPQQRYGEIANELKVALCQGLMQTDHRTLQCQPLSEFSDRLSSIWEAIKQENFIFGFRNTQAIEIYTELQIFYDKEVAKYRNHFYQLAWKIGEESCQEAENFHNEEECFVYYCNKICCEILPVIDTWKESFQKCFSEFIENLADPETGSAHMSSFEVDLNKKFLSWVENTRSSFKTKLTKMFHKEVSGPEKRDEYKRKCISKARSLAEELRGSKNRCELNKSAIQDAYETIYKLWIKEAGHEDESTTGKVKDEFSKIWNESLECLELKLNSFKLKSKAEFGKQVSQCYELMKQVQSNDKSKFEIGFIAKKHLEHNKKFAFLVSAEVEKSSNEIILKIFSRVDQILTENYFNNSQQKSLTLILSEVLEIASDIIETTELPHGWKLSSEIQKALIIRIFGISVKQLAFWQRESILKYSLVAFLEQEKDNIFKDFQIECHSASGDSRAANRFVNDILNSILITQVKVSVGSQIFDAVISTKEFNQKNAMLFYIMKELVDLPMEKVAAYVENYECYLKTWIEEKTVDFCVSKNCLEKMIEDKMHSCHQLVKQILEKMENGIFTQSNQWWDSLDQYLKSNDFFPQVVCF
jgi:hypothetical protein